jgi:tRNA modification GTPase
MRARSDTIAAIATPRGRGGIGVVRVAGRDLATLIEGVVGRVPPPRVATLATFRDAAGRPLDQGLALHFPAPNSYTGDDVLELHGHGGRAVQDALLARCLELGARVADPGEFTERAFLNGRIDLAQAEGVADLIDAATTTAARAAARSLTGEFSTAIGAIRDALVELRTYVEATLDFPEDDVDFVRAYDARGRVDALRARLAAILARARAGARLREGLAIVLVGRPNVGKSSLLNRLVREDAAIVTELPGTTRDTVQRQVEIAGIPISVVDTAGLRDTDDVVEKVGIARTWEAVGSADLALVLVDARDGDGSGNGDGSGAGLAESVGVVAGERTGAGERERSSARGAAHALAAGDAAIVARLDPSLPRLIVHNKADLAGLAASVERRDGLAHVTLSALTGEGLDLLEREVLAIAGASVAGEDAFLARERHLAALREAAAALEAAARHLDGATPPLELFAEELRRAHDALATITGAFTADDLIGAIFSRFCIGK